MSNRDTCHGCEGKGWVMILTVERTMPFRDNGRGAPVQGLTVSTREYDARECIICKGEGTVRRQHATIGEGMALVARAKP